LRHKIKCLFSGHLKDGSTSSQSGKTGDDQIGVENIQIECPMCGSNNVVAKGTKGALGRSIKEVFGFGGLLGVLVSNTNSNYTNSQRIQYKCLKCGKFFIPETKPLESLEQITTACKIILHRGKNMIGGLRPFYVYLNGKNVGGVQNGQSIEFTTNIKFNTITVTDALGNAFKNNYRFNAEEGGKIVLYFDRYFKKINNQ